MKLAYLLIPLLVFAAGCTGLSGIFGGDVLNIKQNLIQQGQKDIIVINDPATIPTSPMLPKQSFLFSFLLENVDKAASARNVVVELFNAPTVKDDKGSLCNTGTGSICKPDKCSVDSDPERVTASLDKETASEWQKTLFGSQDATPNKGCFVLPGEQRPINFRLQTPTQQEIVNIQTAPTLDYRVQYDFESTSLYIMPSVNMDEIIKNQKSNDKVNVEVTKSYGTGPVRIDMDLFGTSYILSDQSATLIFKITNTGSGAVEGSEIEPHNFIVKIPVSMIGVGGVLTLPDGDTFDPTTQQQAQPAEYKCAVDGSGYILCGNINAIPMYKDQTRGSLRFEITKVSTITQPFISYDIRASVKYTYELRGSQQITIKPFEG